MMNELSGVAAAAILFGFLFAGFWWSLNRELTFEASQRHFKPGYALLFVSVAFVGYFGLIAPLREAAQVQPALKHTYHGVTLGIVAVVGYMLTEFGHYSIFQRPKYTTPSEWVFTALTVIALGLMAVRFF
jgi:archaellum biogenesis protein FlaJ (TadC family)